MTQIKYCSLYYTLRESNVILSMKHGTIKRKVILHEDYFRVYFLEIIKYINGNNTNKERFTIERNGVKMFFDIFKRCGFISIYVPREDLHSNESYDIFHVKLSRFTSTISKIFKYYEIKNEDYIFESEDDKTVQIKKHYLNRKRNRSILRLKNETDEDEIIMVQEIKKFTDFIIEHKHFIKLNFLYFIYAIMYITIVLKISDLIVNLINLIFNYQWKI